MWTCAVTKYTCTPRLGTQQQCYGNIRGCTPFTGMIKGLNAQNNRKTQECYHSIYLPIDDVAGWAVKRKNQSQPPHHQSTKECREIPRLRHTCRYIRPSTTFRATRDRSSDQERGENQQLPRNIFQHPRNLPHGMLFVYSSPLAPK